MPWSVKKIDEKFCVVKEGSSTPIKGGCHPSEAEAKKHQAALYAAEEKELSGLDEMETKELYEKMGGMGWYYVPYGITTFRELDAARTAEETAMGMQQLTHDYTQLIGNITGNPEVDVTKAVKALSDEFVTRVETVKNKKKGLLDTIKEAIGVGKKKKPYPKDDEEEEDEEKKDLGMMVWKEADDIYRFIARYSNNLRDNDNPPEIISAASHARFVEMVDKKEIELPEVWLWHVPQWKIGQVDWVAWDQKENGVGFALAGGHFFKEANWLAEKMSSLGTVGVSHGMPKTSIQRDPTDPTVIIEHITREISPLPDWAAANKWADFTALKENTMIPDNKKAKIVEAWNLDPTKLDDLEAGNTKTADKAVAAGVENKEKGVETPAPEETPAAVQVTQETPPTPVAPPTVLDEATVGQIAAALKEILTPVQADMAAINARMAELEDKVKELTATEEDRIAKQIPGIPAASLGAALVKSIIGAQEARVDGRTTLANQKPTLPADMQKAANAQNEGLLQGVVSSIIAEHTHTQN